MKKTLARALKRLLAGAACLVAAAFLLLSFGCGFSGNTGRDVMSGRIRIMLGSAEGLVILSDSCLDILPGETASFDIRLEEGFSLVSLSHGIYDETAGKIIYAGARYPATIIAGTAKDGGSMTRDPLASASPFAGVTPDPYGTAPDASQEASVTPSPFATPESTPTPSPTPTPVAVTLGDPSLIADISGAGSPSSGTVKIVYHAAGGSIAATTSETAAELFPTDFYYCPNTLPDVGYFHREGFLLAGYSSEPDGGGDIYRPGHNIVPAERTVHLYCVWKPFADENDFTVTFEKDYAVVKAYNGRESEVVIPARFSGKKTLIIASGAFSSGNITSVYIPKYVEIVEDGAFRDLSRLEEAYLSDSVLYMSDGAFEGCGSFSKLCIMAVRNPVYQNSVVGCAGSVKYERLITRDGRKIMIVSGSGCLYGTDSGAIQRKIEGGYEFVNLGVHVNLSAAFLCELAASRTEAGDILIVAPEINGYQLGVNGFSTTMWQTLEGSYDAVAAVDLRNYSGVFSSFAAFNRTRRSMTERSYRDRNSEINPYGDLSYSFSGTHKGYKPKQDNYLLEGGTVSLTDAIPIMERYYGSVNRSLEAVKAKGGAALFSFTPVDRACLTEASGGYRAGGAENVTPETGAGPFAETAPPYGAAVFPDIDLYEAYIDGNVSAERISSAEDYILDPEYFWNSEWHVNGAGRSVRSGRLADDVLAYLSEHPELLGPRETPADETGGSAGNTDAKSSPEPSDETAEPSETVLIDNSLAGSAPFGAPLTAADPLRPEGREASR